MQVSAVAGWQPQAHVSAPGATSRPPHPCAAGSHQRNPDTECSGTTISNHAHDHQPTDRRLAKTGRRLRRSVFAGVLALIVLSLAMPFSGVAAAGKSGRTLLAEWSAMSRVSVVQQSSGSISYRGTWRTAYHSGYMDGKARSTNARSAKASLQFTGTAIAWVGPVGPSRGKARVYIDGKLVTTVNTWASTFRASRVLFTKSWTKVGTHRISIVANGTAGHPTVALDAFLVRREKVAQSPPTPAPAGPSVRVTSVAALLTALADNTVTEIVVANGTYRVSPASSKASNSLWIGSRYASRTRAVTVRAETRGGVTFDGGGRDVLRRHQLRGGRPPPDLGRLRVRQRDPDLDRGGGVRRLQRWLGRAAPHHDAPPPVPALDPRQHAARTTPSTSARPRTAPAARTTSCSRTSTRTGPAGSCPPSTSGTTGVTTPGT